MAKHMTVRELKEFIASIPKDNDDLEVRYVDFSGWDNPEARVTEFNGHTYVVIE